MNRGNARRILLAASLLAGSALLWGCAVGTARRVDPVVYGEPTSRYAGLPLERGREVFQRYCYACHPGGEAGLGPSINNRILPRFLVHLQVRRGLGAMPGFSSEVISDGDLDALLDYVGAMRRSLPPEEAYTGGAEEGGPAL